MSTKITRETILHNLFINPQINEAIAKLNRPELHDDLKQEMFVVLCSWPEHVLIEKYEQQYLLWSVLRIMSNMYKSSTSPFHKVFRQAIDELADMNDKPVFTGEQSEGDLFTRGAYQHVKPLTDTPDSEEVALNRVAPAIAELDKNDWYLAGVFRLFVDSGCNHAAVVRKTGIPETSIRTAVKAARSTLKTFIRA